ncbi:hypothetical protein HU200_046107 [Digitaria exilis]|uniref:Phorbol-ester/DAG-type domain-containing protein n=1 Tax=Digitaria exilis TaxID=1010633 RepID=A0A835ED25_9POAL|nr:hypothetical protein HU200_046107 [Digitaria exilis]CAB3458585.1 unnamed protein product [Digitaria exilis]
MASRRHFADPHHPLVWTHHSPAEAGLCSICLLPLAGRSGYGCYTCNIQLHGACADHFREAISFFAHPSHALTLSRSPSPDGRACDICRGHCPPGSFVYRCVECGFDAHPLCTLLPETVGDDLRMVSSSSSSPAGCCSACPHPLPTWHYACSDSRRLHVTCAVDIIGQTTTGDAVVRDGPPADAFKGGVNNEAAARGIHGAQGRERVLDGPAGQGWSYGPANPGYSYSYSPAMPVYGGPAGPAQGGYFGGPFIHGGYWPPYQGGYYGASGVPVIQGGYGPPFQGGYYPPVMPAGGHGNGGGGGHGIFHNPGTAGSLMTGIAGFLANVAISAVVPDLASGLLSAILGN